MYLLASVLTVDMITC